MDPRGDDIALTAGKQTEARFGFMFKDPPSYGPPDELLQQLAAQMGEPTDTGWRIQPFCPVRPSSASSLITT